MDAKIEEFMKRFRKKYQDMSASEFPGFFLYGSKATPEDENVHAEDENDSDFTE